MNLPFKGKFRVSQRFGENPESYAKFLVKQPDGSTGPMKGHNGIDFACPAGTSIIAPFACKVVEVGFDPYGYGNYVKVESESYGSVFAHFDTVVVSVGYELKEGDEIGLSGDTGNSTGPHLHWGFYTLPRDRANGYAGFVDQMPIIAYLLDDSPKADPAVEKPKETTPMTALSYTQEQYQAAMEDRNAFWKQRDEANKRVSELEEENKNLKTENLNLVATNQKLVLQVNEITRKNESIYLMLADKEKEDYTAISIGIEAMNQLKELKGDIVGAIENKDGGLLFGTLQKIVDKIKMIFKFGKKVKDGEVTISVKKDEDVLSEMGINN